jgi:hypothetical protein
MALYVQAPRTHDGHFGQLVMLGVHKLVSDQSPAFVEAQSSLAIEKSSSCIGMNHNIHF